MLLICKQVNKQNIYVYYFLFMHDIFYYLHYLLQQPLLIVFSSLSQLLTESFYCLVHFLHSLIYLPTDRKKNLDQNNILLITSLI